MMAECWRIPNASLRTRGLTKVKYTYPGGVTVDLTSDSAKAALLDRMLAGLSTGDLHLLRSMTTQRIVAYTAAEKDLMTAMATLVVNDAARGSIEAVDE